MKYTYDLLKINNNRYILILKEDKFIIRIFLLNSLKEGKDILKKHYSNYIYKVDNITKKEIKKYLSGKTKKFSLNYKLKKITKFQKKVFDEVKKIKYGETVSYSYIAKKINSPKSTRAVGNALKQNPLPLIIPCHRVIKKTGELGGFMGNKKEKIEWKKFLLEIEK